MKLCKLTIDSFYVAFTSFALIHLLGILGILAVILSGMVALIHSAGFTDLSKSLGVIQSRKGSRGNI